MNEQKKNLGFEKDVIHSAALAFHKALIGVVQLKELESCNLRLPKAVITYYIVYHIFTLCMLLDEGYSGEKIESFDLNALNSKSELPEEWNLQRKLEEDYATRIKHSEIKKYCVSIRKKKTDKLSSTEKILFENFIKQPPDGNAPCISGLYEKLCYVRDRAIYRPSVVKLKDGSYVQTSLDVKREIDSLPDSRELYKVICSIYREFISGAKQIKKYNYLLAYMWCCPVDCSDVFEKLNSRDAALLKTMECFNAENGFNPHICHMLELYDDISQIKKFDDMYWRPLCDEFLKMRIEKYSR